MFCHEFCILVVFLCGTSIIGTGGTDDQACPSGMFRCGAPLFPTQPSTERLWCISEQWKCDGEKDCPDGSDEGGYCPPPTCPSNKFQCKDHKLCIPNGWLCDSENDCIDGSDESDEVCSTYKKLPRYNSTGPENDVEYSCPPNQYQCDGADICLYYTDICDSVRDCPDGEDEGPHCVLDGCSDKECHGAHCRETRQGPVCYCDRGSYFNSTTLGCVDLDECVHSEPCDQICTNQQPLYQCSCVEGYMLVYGICLADNFNDPAYLLVSYSRNGSVLASVEMGDRDKERQIAKSPSGDIRSFDYNFNNFSVCYIVSTPARAYFTCAGFNSTAKWDIDITVSLSSVIQVAFDWLSENWYFIDDKHGKIFVCKYDGSKCLMLIHTDLEAPKALALDPTRGLMFFTSLGESPKLERASMDGKRRFALVPSRQIVRPQSLTLDYAMQHVYWLDSYLDRIERINYDGTGRKLILKHHTESIISLALHNNLICGTSKRDNSVECFDRLNRTYVTPNIFPHLPGANLVKVFHLRRQPPVDGSANICKNKGCAHLCVTVYDDETSSLQGKCLCTAGFKHDPSRPENCVSAMEDSFLLYTNSKLGEVQGISMDSDLQDYQTIVPVGDLQRPVAVDYHNHKGSQYIYYSDTRTRMIGRRKLDGTDRNDSFISKGIYNCEGIAIDWMGNNIFWTDEELKTVSVARLDKPEISRVLVRQGISHPRAIVVSPQTGYMFWTDWVQRPSTTSAKIERAWMDGTNREVLNTGFVQWPNGLSYDFDHKRLYWCDAYTDRIEYYDFDLNTTCILAQGLKGGVKHPYGLVHNYIRDLYLDLYWTEYSDGHIRHLRLTDQHFNHNLTNPCPSQQMPGVIGILRNESVPLFELRLYTLQMGENMCSHHPNVTNCDQLCLALPGNQRVCACRDGMNLTDETRCQDAGNSTEKVQCNPDTEFQCYISGRCINKKWTCDGDNDCGAGDNSDEDNSPSGECFNFTCPNAESMHRCSNNRCIYTRWMCDGDDDCRTGEDENTTLCNSSNCTEDMFRCEQNRRCIPRSWLCDHDNDCGDWQDEKQKQNCTYDKCRRDQFTCENKRCISREYVCDGDNDCRDNSDEEDCPPPEATACNNATHFSCQKTGKCLDKIFLCDGEDNCGDFSDETRCDNLTACQEKREYQCKNGHCIPLQLLCDSDDDCGDNSDEKDCSGSTPIDCGGGFKCKDENRCLPSHWRCDGEHDCQDKSDELNCVEECKLPNFQCNNTVGCIPYQKVCDNHYDCEDHSDEGFGCILDFCENHDCSHNCTSTPVDFICRCPTGKKLGPDDKTCVDGAPCSKWGVCSQDCIEASNGRYACTCYEGYYLDIDEFTCKPKDNFTAQIIFSNRHEIRRLGINQQTFVSLISGLRNTIALDYYYSDGSKTGENSLVFWTDVVDDKIYRGTMISNSISNIEVVVEVGLSTAEGLAIDWITKHLYWVESNLDQIEVANFNGSQRATLMAGNMESPRAIALDPRAGKLFWTDWDQGFPRIEMCSMSGNPDTRRVLFNVSNINRGGWPNGLTVDYDTQRIYWIDAKSDSIHTLSYTNLADVDHREVLKDHEFLSHPFAISVFGNYVYWTDWRTNSLVKANKWNGTDIQVIQRTITQPFDLQVFHPKRQKSFPNPCANNNGGCSPEAICLLDFNAVPKCRCPHLYQQINSTNSCAKLEQFLVFARKTEIRGVDMKNSHFNVMPALTLPHVHNPLALDFDSQTERLYWTEGDVNHGHVEIVSAKLDGTEYKTIIDSGVTNLYGFAIDWVAKNMFFSTYDDLEATISVAKLNGAYRTAVLQSSTMESPLYLKRPRSLVVHPGKGILFWANSIIEGEGQSNIYRASMDGSEYTELFSADQSQLVTKPGSLTIDYKHDELWWLNEQDLHIVKIYHSNLDGSSPTVFEPEITNFEALTILTLTVEDGWLFYASNDRTTDQSTLAWIDQSGDNSTLEKLPGRMHSVLAMKVYKRSRADLSNGCALANGGCNQLCLPRGDTDRVCKCTPGYELDNDGTTCVGIRSFLMYSIDTEILGISLKDMDMQALAPISKIKSAIAIDFYAEEDYIFWVDNKARTISRIKRDLTQQETLVNSGLYSVEGLAVDWIAGNMYWTDQSLDVIEVSRLDGSNKYVVVHGDLEKPKSIVVDPLRGFMYWSDTGPNPKIEKARLDGTNRTVLVNSSILQPSGLALDHEANVLYWCDSRSDQLNKLDLETGTRTSLLEDIEMTDCRGLSIWQDYVYWIDASMSDGAIFQANKLDGSNVTAVKTNLGPSVRDIKVFHTDKQKGSNKCSPSLGYGGCEELCLYTSLEGASSCHCAHGKIISETNCTNYDQFLAFSKVSGIETVHMFKEFDPNAPMPPIEDEEHMKNVIGLTMDFAHRKYYYSDIQRGDIQSVTFDGKDHQVISRNVGSAEGLAFDPFAQELYWTSYTNSSINRMIISRFKKNSKPERLIQLGPEDHPRAIVVHPCKSKIYWTNWNDRRARIQSAFMSGSKITDLITTDIKTPNGLTIDHPAEKLYWLDARLDKIERCDIDGTNRKIIVSNMPQHGFGLAVFGDYLYWTDWVLRSVIRANKYTGAEVVYLVKNIPRQPMGIVAVSKSTNNCLDSPCLHKGGCHQQCTTDAHAQVQCSCFANFTLATDNRTCVPAIGAACEPGQFACLSRGCIDFELTCDGIVNCVNGSDEDPRYCRNRVCPPNYFQCSNERCILRSKLCDHRDDCKDGSDERDCGCKNTEFRCRSDGSCILARYRCDLDKDCPDASDEMGCNTTQADCRSFGSSSVSKVMKCPNTTACILQSWKCDGHNDCWDNSDEIGCTTTNATALPCADGWTPCKTTGECIPRNWLCDRDFDCSDQSDEGDDCSYEPCGDGMFTCNDQSCIDALWHCDGKPDCLHHEDEDKCPSLSECNEGFFKCQKSGNCIPRSWLCDHEPDCLDGQDEHPSVGCEFIPCNEDEFQCLDFYCIPRSFYCDGHPDCLDESDEPKDICVYPECDKKTEFTCPHITQCIPSYKVCDGVYDCEDHQDETDQCSVSPCGDNMYFCDNGICINQTLVCNRWNDCGDSSDELLCGLNECEVYPSSCNATGRAKCHDLKIGYECICDPGYELADDEVSCKDVDECKTVFPCSQYCFNTIGSYSCSCADNYTLTSNKRGCKVNSEIQAILLISNRYYIRNITMDGSRVALVAQRLNNAVALDFDWQDRKIYWSDVTSNGSSINRMTDHGEDKETLHNSTVRNPDGIAVDWMGRNLYWCDKTTDTIEVSKLDGRYRKILIRDGLQEPRAIVVHPDKGWLFYTDWGDNAHIGRIGMDGSQRSNIITDYLGWPNALTVDFVTDRVFWADASLNYIAMTDLDGNNRHYIIKSGLPHVFAMTVFEDYIYWTDWEHKSVEYAHKYSGFNRSRITQTIHRPMDIQVYHPMRQPASFKKNKQNPCEDSDCGEGTLCLIKPGGNGYVCACPDRHYPSRDKRSCIANCTSSEFLCENTYKCIPFWWRCDNQNDCGDLSDEPEDCPAYYCRQPGLFQCKDAKDKFDCISPGHICDGVQHCRDGSDEQNCERYTCMETQFKCNNQCIPLSYRCNDVADCPDRSDEKGCPQRTCASNQFPCSNKRCIPYVWKCDNDDDCGDGSDEPPDCKDSDCLPGHIKCSSSGRCIPEAWKCDGDHDCGDNDDSDEPPDCENITCGGTYFKCSNNRCIPGRWKCDYDDDCRDGSDEENCELRNCSESEWKCENSRCILKANKCDGQNNCGDNSDESLPECVTRTVECEDGEVSCDNHTHCIPTQWKCDHEVDCIDASDETDCNLTAKCLRNEFRCHNGLCIPQDFLCDGFPDCPDKSDEILQYCLDNACSPGRFRCTSKGRCISYQDVCDGVNHCLDGSDERTCGVRRCRSGEFQCTTNDTNLQCIDAKFVCDGHFDCLNKADEKDICNPAVTCAVDSDCADEHICNTEYSYGGRCECPEGFKDEIRYNSINGSVGATCVDLDECTEFARCSQLCVNKKGSYHCKCDSNYIVQRSGPAPVCVQDGLPPYLLVAVESELKLASVNAKNTSLHQSLHLTDPNQNVANKVLKIGSVDVYADQSTAFITDHSKAIWTYAIPSTLDSSAASGHSRTKRQRRQSPSLGLQRLNIPDLQQPKGIAVEWVSKTIYWTDSMAGTIQMASFDGSFHRTVVSSHLVAVDDIVVDPESGRLFWALGGINPKIESCYLDGSNRTVLVNHNIRWPSGLDMDHPNRRLYWADAKKKTIESILVDGTQRHVVSKFDTEDITPFKISVYLDDLYVTSYETHTVYKMDKFGKRNNERTVLIQAGLRVSDIFIMQTTKQKALEDNPCKPSPCPQDSVCLAVAGNASCLCAEGKTLRADGLSCDPAPPPEECHSQFCLNNGTCSLNADGVPKCRCLPGFHGRQCEKDVCYHYCLSGGQCRPKDDPSKPGKFKAFCDCPHGYDGPRCENYVCSDYCQNGGLCTVSKYTQNKQQCTCPVQYKGDRCEKTKTSPCDNNDCGNGGTCFATDDDKWSYNCSCSPRFTGSLCQNCRYDCDESGRNCQDYFCDQNNPKGTYCDFKEDNGPKENPHCSCPPGYVNSLKCDDPNDPQRCDDRCISKCDQYCDNGGVCELFGDVPMCTCPAPYTGQRCRVDSCQDYCRNGGTCTYEEGKEQSCKCTIRFQGPQCEEEITGKCSLDNFCQNGGTCVPKPGTQQPNGCACPVHYTGPRCETMLTCNIDTCQNGGACASPPDKPFKCLCARGYMGPTCGDIMPKECVNYCQNEGICLNCDTSSSLAVCLTCDCTSGFQGDHCETEAGSGGVPGDGAKVAAIVVPLILCIIVIMVVVAVCIYRKRSGIQFRHKRMTDNSNVEISNPIYMKDYEDDEVPDDFTLDPDRQKIMVVTPGNQIVSEPTNFTNPMYNTLYNENPQGDTEKKGLLKKGKKRSKKATEHLLADEDFDSHDPGTSFA